MRKLFIVVAVLTISTVTFAQFSFSGATTLGKFPTIGEGFGIGLNARGNYAFNDKWELSTGFTYVFPSRMQLDMYKGWQINSDLHYSLYKGDKFKHYALAGINFSHEKRTLTSIGYSTYGGYGSSEVSVPILNYSAITERIGCNIGLGTEYKKFFGEVKYDSGFSQAALTLGFKF